MGLKLLLIVVLLVCETISLDFAGAGPDGTPDDDDGTGDVTEGSGDSNIPTSLLPEIPLSSTTDNVPLLGSSPLSGEGSEIPLNARNFTPGIDISRESGHGFNPNITNEQLNAELTGPGKETSIPGGATGLIFSHSVLVPYFFVIVVSHF